MEVRDIARLAAGGDAAASAVLSESGRWLGMGLADGQYALALSVTGITLLVLWGFPALERWSAGSATSAMRA